jgi:hypothetical protein
MGTRTKAANKAIMVVFMGRKPYHQLAKCQPETGYLAMIAITPDSVNGRGDWTQRVG